MSLRTASLLLGLTVVGSVVPAPVVALGPGPTFDTLGEVNGTPVVSNGQLLLRSDTFLYCIGK